MFRRRKNGKEYGNYYAHHPVTLKKVSLGTANKKWAQDKLRKLEEEAHERAMGRHVELWEKVSERWMDRNQHLANYQSQKAYNDFWMPHLTGRKLNAIDEEFVHETIMRERAGVSLKDRVPANSTANNYVRFVAKIQRFGKVTPPKYHVYPAVKQGKGALTPEQWTTWRDEMEDDLRLISTHLLATGLRSTNVRKFEWTWLHAGDTRAFLPITVTKTDKPYGIPLNLSAQGVIAEVRKQSVRHKTCVFTHNGQPWDASTLLVRMKKSSLAVLGFEVTPHWLRHTFRSWLAQEGVSDSVARRLGCWKLGSGADSKYLHFDVEPLRRFAEVLDGPLGVSLSSQGAAKVLSNQPL